MSDFISPVKRARDLMLRSADTLRDSKPALASDREEIAEGLSSAIDRMIELESLTKALPPDIGNIHDLPAELLAELSVLKTDKLEDQIFTVINAYGGEASLDQILIGLYRKFQDVHKRRFMQNKLYRMSMVWSVDGKKGFYTTRKPEVETESSSDVSGRVDYPQDYDSEVPF